MVIVKAVVSVLVSLLLGAFGLSLLFADLSPSETMAGRLIFLAFLYLLTGFIFGYVNPRVWLFSGVVAWGGVFIGLEGLSAGTSATLLLAFSLGTSYGGGYLGKLLWRKRHPDGSSTRT
ncbi:MAG: hypothetical protein ABIH70_01330 [Chloroflexota bacterium]